MPTQYTYESLSIRKRDIRILEILPSKLGWTKIRCHLVIVPLNQAPPYEALSYTWGTSCNSYTIEIDGEQHHVSKNLHEALCTFRYTKESRYLWVDAISINQADKVELGEQVRIMPEIYRMAFHVRIWIGRNDRKSTLAMKYLNVLGADFGEHLTEDSVSQLKRPGEDFIDASRLPELITAKDQETLRKSDPFDNLVAVAQVPDLLSRPWFSRVWIVQEVALSQLATVHCGDESISWQTLIRGARIFALLDDLGRPHTKNLSKAQIRGMQIIARATARIAMPARTINDLDTFRMFQQRPSPLKPHIPRLEDVFAQMRDRSTSDGRDRIYAAQGLLPFDIPGTMIIPDYASTEQSLHLEVALQFLQKGSLQFLRYCQPHPTSSCLPSWLIDWSENRLTPPLQEGIFTSYYRRYRASAATAAKFRFITRIDHRHPGLLVASGIFVDSVITVTCNYELQYAKSPHWEAAAMTCAGDSIPRNQERSNSPDPEMSIQDVLHHEEPRNHSVGKEEEMRHCKYKTGCPLWVAYVRTLIADRTTGDQTSDDILLVLGVMRHAKGYKHSHFTWSPQLMSRLPESVTSKALITTQTGYMGLGPQYTQPGDQIVVLCGVEVPLILRKAACEDVYHIVGEVYIHGIMEGELFKTRSIFDEQNPEYQSFTIH